MASSLTRLPWRALLGLVTLLSLVLASSSAALASLPIADAPRTLVTGPTGIAVSPSRLEIGLNPSTHELQATLAITNLAHRPLNVRVELKDLWISANNTYQPLDLGQTSYSFNGQANLSVDVLHLGPAATPGAVGQAVFSAHVADLTQPLYGAILIEPDADGESAVDLGGAQVATQTAVAVLVPLLLSPLAEDDRPDRLRDSVTLSLKPDSLSADQSGQAGLLDHVLPFSLPGMADHGPLQAKVGVTNTGNAFGRAFTTYEFSAVSPLGWLPASLRDGLGVEERPFLRAEAAPAALMPGQSGETQSTTEMSTGPDHIVDTAPLFGLVRVRASTTLHLVDAESSPAVQEMYLLLFPWKEGLVLVGLFFLQRAARRFAARRMKRHSDVDRRLAELHGGRRPAKAA